MYYLYLVRIQDTGVLLKRLSLLLKQTIHKHQWVHTLLAKSPTMLGTVRNRKVFKEPQSLL